MVSFYTPVWVCVSCFCWCGYFLYDDSDLNIPLILQGCKVNLTCRKLPADKSNCQYDDLGMERKIPDLHWWNTNSPRSCALPFIRAQEITFRADPPLWKHHVLPPPLIRQCLNLRVIKNIVGQFWTLNNILLRFMTFTQESVLCLCNIGCSRNLVY